MAYYKRSAISGRPEDPRSWRYAIYFCQVCSKESEFTIVPNFTYEPRVCKHCHCLDSNDKLTSLKAEREDILKQINNLNAKLMHIETELYEYNQMEVVESK